jgi:hypothetical protein
MIMKPAARFLLGFVLCAMLMLVQSSCYGREETYKLGGMREPVVTVKENRKGFDVTARFLAVDAFDTATNQKLNRQKGRGFAFIALARFMGIDTNQSVSASGVTPTGMRLRDRSIELSFTIEKDKIHKVNRPALLASEPPQSADHTQDTAGGTSTERDVSLSLARAADYRDTLALIDAEGRNSAADLLESRADLYEAIAGIEDQTLDLFESVRRQVESDEFLQQEDRNRILCEIVRTKKDFLMALRVEFQILEASTK